MTVATRADAIEREAGVNNPDAPLAKDVLHSTHRRGRVSTPPTAIRLEGETAGWRQVSSHIISLMLPLLLLCSCIKYCNSTTTQCNVCTLHYPIVQSWEVLCSP